jgi:MinD-like ATPase involved in chromosome partitioning or flagellar assembly
MLACAVATDDRRVLLVDASNQLSPLHQMLGLTPRHSLTELRGGAVEPEALLVPLAAGLTLLPDDTAAAETPLSATERALLRKRAASLYEGFDVVVIDAGSTVESLVGVCAAGVSRFIAVTSGDRIAVVATYAVLKTLATRCPGVSVELLANRVDQESCDRAVEYLRAACDQFLNRDLVFAGLVPDDHDFTSALGAGFDAREAAAGSPAVALVRPIGERVLSEAQSTTPASSRGVPRSLLT